MQKLRYISFISLVFISLGCGGGGGGGGSDDSPNACSALNLRVANGDDCSLQRTPVVLILGEKQNGRYYSCSGTMITPTVALTAAHCVPNDLVAMNLYTEKNTFSLTQGSINGLSVHPRYEVFPDGHALYDFALIRLASAADASPVPLALSSTAAVGDKITVYGFGADESGHSALDRSAKDALKAGVMQVTNSSSLLLEASYDLTGQSVCPGDSGGPAVKEINGQNAIVGITSFGSASGCLQGSFAYFAAIQDPSVFNFIRAGAPDLVTR